MICKMETVAFDTCEKGLLLLTGLFFLIQAFYYFFLYNRIYLHQKKADNGSLPFTNETHPVSVIIYAHDGTLSLRQNLTAILNQDYPQFEVIVIKDGHNDESEDYLTAMEERHDNLYHSFVPDTSRYISRKKLAITLGIRASKYEWIILTDANCTPQSDQWLRLMARNFTSNTQIVLGYSGYEKEKGKLNRNISFDNLFTAMRYLGFALNGHPYMGIGRNLAYRKDLYYHQKGFTAHLNLKRGEDDLFVNQAATSENTRVETDSQAAMRMPTAATSQEWKEEKIGYTATSHFYRGAQRWLCGAETATRLLFYTGWIASCIVGGLHGHWSVAGIALASFLLRLLLQAFVINKNADAVGEGRHYFFSLPLYDWLLPLQSFNRKLHFLFRHKEEFLRK